MADGPLQVLLISDRESDHDTVGALLAELNWSAAELTSIRTLNDCVAAVRKNAHDVCLVGPRLEALAALDLLAEVYSHGCAMPCVVIADGAQEDFDERAREVGAVDVVASDDLTPSLFRRCLRYAVDGHRLRRRLDQSDRRFDMLASVSMDGIWDWDVPSGHVTYSERWKRIIGCDPQDVACSIEEWFNRIHPSDVEKVRAELDAHMQRRLPHFESQHRLRHKQGNYRWVLARGLAHWDPNDKPLRMAGTLTDITGRAVLDSQMEPGGAYYDALTGLPNREVFRERVERSLDRSRRHDNYLFAAVCLDLDRFKVINDSLGHMVGDQLLVTIARRIEADLRTTDTLARLGGDVFGLLLDDIRDVSDALRVADRLQEHLSEPFSLRGQEVFTTASMGIALSSHGYTEPDDLLRDADIAMHRAKAQGKARHEIFDKDMHDNAVKRLNIESGLRRALERQEFVVHYQPIVKVSDRRLAGFEALVRWQEPTEGLIPPNDFIPIAEETGVIIGIDRWVLRESCRQLREWQDANEGMRPLALSFNLSRRQLLQEDLVDYIQGCIEEFHLDPDLIRPEITESQVMENFEVAAEMLDRLKGLNIHLHMDDFGTGYSSLSNLVRMHIDLVKIDGSFVGNMDVRGENFEIVRMIVSLAHNLGMQVIAEGVETAEQFGLLKTLKCEYVQGYHFSRPVPAEEMGRLIAKDVPW